MSFAWPPDVQQYRDRLRDYSARKCRLFAVAWCRKHIKEITNPDCLALIEIAELYAAGRVSRNRLRQHRWSVHRWGNAGWGTTEWGPTWIGTWAAWNAALERIAPPCPGYVNLDANYADVASEVFGNPDGLPAFSPSWRTDTAVSLARTMYESREFSAMPILADALQDAGCDSDDILNHCREPQLLSG